MRMGWVCAESALDDARSVSGRQACRAHRLLPANSAVHLSIAAVYSPAILRAAPARPGLGTPGRSSLGRLARRPVDDSASSHARCPQSGRHPVPRRVTSRLPIHLQPGAGVAATLLIRCEGSGLFASILDPRDPLNAPDRGGCARCIQSWSLTDSCRALMVPPSTLPSAGNPSASRALTVGQARCLGDVEDVESDGARVWEPKRQWDIEVSSSRKASMMASPASAFPPRNNTAGYRRRRVRES
jgi:hypothetical protein